MNPTSRLALIPRLTLALLAAVPMTAAQPNTPRLVLAADSNWKFLLGDPTGAEARSFDVSKWRSVDLPHDWSIEGRPAKDNPTASGGGFFPSGTGWYRKNFIASPEWKGKRVSVEFDGVYRDATVYLNGHKLGNQPYGYTSFRLDLTTGLDFSGPNVLAVRVDNSAQPNSRWYSGSGIYRHVRVLVTDPVHVAHWGVFITTREASVEAATISVRTRVQNESAMQSSLTVETRIVDEAGKSIGGARSTIEAAPGREGEVRQEIGVAGPGLWSPASPMLYRAQTRVFRDGKVVDEVETPFGIRTLAWSAEKGLLLNGKTIKLAGGSVHHDNGPLGAMAFDQGGGTPRTIAESGRVQSGLRRFLHSPLSPASRANVS